MMDRLAGPVLCAIGLAFTGCIFSGSSCDSPAPGLGVTPLVVSGGDELRVQFIGSLACSGDLVPDASEVNLVLSTLTRPVRVGDAFTPGDEVVEFATVPSSFIGGPPATIVVSDGVPGGEYVLYIEEAPDVHSERLTINA